MKRVTWGLAAVVVLAAVSVALAAQQGPGRGNGTGICPYGVNAPQGPGGGWWTRAQATTPEQKEFLQQVQQMHQAIRLARLDLAQLTDPAQREAKKAEISSLQTKLHDLQIKNTGLIRQMMVNAGAGRGQRVGRGNGMGRGGARTGRGCGTGPCGMGCGMCPGCGGCPFRR